MATLLLIADIGGYTRFMKVHRINLAHAQDVIAQLLEAVIDGAKPGLRLSKLEGDAALFYADVGNEKQLAQLAEHVARIRQAFVDTRTRMDMDRACTCDSCTQVGQLKLKFVAHVGEVAMQRVKRFTELAGFDVILVHRMLKNGVPISEYLLMTDPLREKLPPQVQDAVVRQQEDFEGVGVTDVHYLPLDAIAQAQPPILKKSLARSLWAWLRMTLRTLPYMAGLKRSCDGYRNMGEALGELPAAKGEAAPQKKALP